MFLVTGFIFLVMFSIALLLILYSFFLKAKASDLSVEVSEVKAKIASLSLPKQKTLLVSERLATIRNIISQRSDIETRVSQILSFIPESFAIDLITAERDQITVRISSGNLSLFDNFYEVKLPSLARDNNVGFKKIESTSFARSGNYQLTVDFYFGAD